LEYCSYNCGTTNASYKLSGLPMKISDTLVEKKNKKGTKPGDATQAEVDEIHNLLMETIDQTRLI
jgi:hypothetical protein